MDPDEQHDELWNLLGKAHPVTPSPFFARNVLRKIRAGQSRQRSLADRLAGCIRPWRMATISALMVLLIGLNLTILSPRSRNRAEISQIAATSSDFEVIAHLDDLMASEETSLWTDSLPE